MQGNVLLFSYHGEDEGSDGMHTKVWLAFVKEYASSNLVRLEVRHIPGNSDARRISA